MSAASPTPNFFQTPPMAPGVQSLYQPSTMAQPSPLAPGQTGRVLSQNQSDQFGSGVAQFGANGAQPAPKFGDFGLLSIPATCCAVGCGLPIVGGFLLFGGLSKILKFPGWAFNKIREAVSGNKTESKS